MNTIWAGEMVSNNTIIAALFCISTVLSLNDVHAAQIINHNITGGLLDWYQNTIVNSTANIYGASINVNKSLFLNNFGLIDASINICSDCVLYFQNNGVFSGTVNFENDAKLIQVISRVDDFGALGSARIDGVMVQNGNKVLMSDIAGIGVGDLTLNNSSVVLDTMDLSFITRLDLYGKNQIYVDKDFVITSSPLFENVSGDGILNIVSDVSEDLMGFKTYIEDGKLYVKRVRETDYEKILRNDMGRFINQLREEGADKKLLSALDGAPNMTSLRNVMDKSVRLNPIKLMDVPRMMDRGEGTLPTREGVSLDSIVVTGDVMGAYGVRGNMDARVHDGLNMGISGYMYVGEYSDEINEYEFASYGANIHAKYKGVDGYFIRGQLGASESRFGLGPVFNGAEVVTDPVGYNIYTTADLGVSIRMHEEWNFSPFLGMAVNRASILQDKDVDFSTRAGIVASYGFEIAGLRYDYDLYAAAYSSFDFDVGVSVHFLSVLDDLGGGISLSLIRDEVLGISYKASFDAKIKF